MKINWVIEDKDIEITKKLIKSQIDSPFVKRRIERNVDTSYIPLYSRGKLWNAMIACLLSTQQKSGPNSTVTQFCSCNPFFLNLKKCLSQSKRLNFFVEETLTKFGGIRFTKTISKHVEKNLIFLNTSGWDEIDSIAQKLMKCREREPKIKDIKIERKSALFVDENLKGFGPKQSRNLWQTLGLFRYEIPVDSRIIKWLNENIFPFKLTAPPLSDVNYYEFVMNGIQKLCKECEELPCILDAAIFSSFDEKWEEELIW